MSYCRWSSDNFKSDVYVYANVNGYWTIHVAGVHIVSDVPPAPSFEDPDFVRKNEVHASALLAATREPIGLPYDGTSFDLETPGECADKLEELRGLGYNVPQYAIERLRQEEEEDRVR